MPDQSMTPDNPGGHPDAALGEAAVAHASLEESAANSAEPTEDDLELFRKEYYDRHKRVIRTDRRLGFLLLLVVVAFVLLAFRTEMNDTNLRNGLYTACQARVTQAEAINQVRQVFIGTIATSQAGRTEAEKQAIIQQLQGFLQPLEDCGPPPQ